MVGEFARTPRYQGAGSSQVNPTRVDVLLDELQAVLRRRALRRRLRHRRHRDDEALLRRGRAVAGSADTVVVVLGLPAADESEGFDRTHMDLPANQLAVLQAVAAVNPDVVVVLVNGSTVLLGDVIPHARPWSRPGSADRPPAAAIVDVLTGAVNPSGELAETVPHRLEDNSSYLNFPGDSQVVRYGEGLFVGYRGYDKADDRRGLPVRLRAVVHDLRAVRPGGDDTWVGRRGHPRRHRERDRHQHRRRSTGPRWCRSTCSDVESSVARPVRELKGFAKVHLAAGASARRVRSSWTSGRSPSGRSPHGRWAVEAGDFVVEVGPSSRDLPLSETGSRGRAAARPAR